MGNGCVGACCRCTYVRYWVLPYYLIPYLDSTYLTYIYIYIQTYIRVLCVHTSIHRYDGDLVSLGSVARKRCVPYYSIHSPYVLYIRVSSPLTVVHQAVTTYRLPLAGSGAGLGCPRVGDILLAGVEVVGTLPAVAHVDWLVVVMMMMLMMTTTTTATTTTTTTHSSLSYVMASTVCHWWTDVPTCNYLTCYEHPHHPQAPHETGLGQHRSNDSPSPLNRKQPPTTTCHSPHQTPLFTPTVPSVTLFRRPSHPRRRSPGPRVPQEEHGT
jgi:hypothetical protein